jgi:hypothetical protein
MIVRKEYKAHVVPLRKIQDIHSHEVMDEQQILGFFVSSHYQWLS